MSGNFRFGFAALLLVAGFVTPAASNPLTDLFSPHPAPEAAAPGPAQEECLPQPGKSTAPGQRWVYHHEGQRKCWFQAEASTALARKPAHHHAVSELAAKEQSESTRREQERSVDDARAEMLSSAPAAPAEPAPPAPELKLANATPVLRTSATGSAPTGPFVGSVASDQVAPKAPKLPQLNDEALLAAAPTVPNLLDTSGSPTSAAVKATAPEKSEDGYWSTAKWLGMLLMALGGVAFLSASRGRRAA